MAPAKAYTVYVSNEKSNTISVIDTQGKEIAHKISFEIAGIRPEAIQPLGARIISDVRLGFVALGPANRVAVIDAQSFEMLDYLLVGQRVWQLACTGDEKFLFSTNGVSNDVSVIDLEKLKVIKSFALGRLPWGAAIKD